eukprot:TRINITY_DN7009_c0_g1_i4.p1 TRINITY_DN7009_c0_g1~~TRINITY_DN7009_c0_g1_i4.p1  ORF type:complete len:143 (-),score=50.42 TRINITY_DN7009_c0_g1_i4:347-775(-)
MLRSLVGSEMCIRDRYQRRVRGIAEVAMMNDGVLSQYPDEDIQQEHRKYCHLSMESIGRLTAFMEGQLPTDLAHVPGIGEQGIKILNKLGIETLDQLLGQFLMFDRDTAKMLEWCETNRIGGARFAQTVVHSLAMKAHSLLD